jgi:GNAT superfamily N-acetyltransferase
VGVNNRLLPDKQVSYIRNSVKATVDAYDGTVTLYAQDEKDPVLTAWMKTFPGTIKPKSEITPELAAHLRWHRGFADGGDIGGMTLNDDTDLPDGLVMPAFNSWSWFWTDAVRAQVSLDADVVEIAHEDPRLKELLAHSPTAAHERDGKAPHIWFGIVEGDQLLSVAAVDKNGSSTLVQNVVTHADARGRGLATRVCSHATAWSLLEAPYATLGMMTDNEAAERIYLSLGYVCDKRFRSGLFG